MIDVTPDDATIDKASDTLEKKGHSRMTKKVC